MEFACRLDFHGSGAFGVGAPLADVIEVGAPIGDHPIAVVEIAHPARSAVEIVRLVDPLLHIGNQRSWAEPHLVIEAGRRGRFDRRFVRKSFFWRAGANGVDLADEPVADQLHGAVHGLERAELAVDAKHALVFGHEVGEDAPFVDGACDWLFQRDIRARLDRGDCHRRMPVVGS